MKKGFTLIELLAVIIILAILATIITPVAFNLIDDYNKKSFTVSMQHYIDAVNTELLNQEMIGEYQILDGIYEISNKGKVLTKDENNILYLDYNGNGIMEGSLVVKNGSVKQIIDGKIENWYASIISGEVVLSENSNQNILVTGQEFRDKILELAGGLDSSNIYDSVQIGVNTTITSITFLSDGKLPEGYTKEDLKKLLSTDVSEKQNQSIMAYYDNNGSIYVYSDGKIISNLDSTFMFANLYGLTTLNLKNLDTSIVNKMSLMFMANGLTTIDLSSFDMSSVTEIFGMYMYSNLNTLNLSMWDTSNITNMPHLFYYCENLTSLDLSGWATSNVTDMSYMFQRTPNLTCVQVGEKWSTSQADTTDMFLNSGISEVTTDYCKAN